MTHELYYDIYDIDMSNNKVITNLRVDRDSWIQIKVMAAELGMSVNEYINYLIRDLSARRLLKVDFRRERLPIWRLGKIATKSRGKDLSSEDKIIYD